MSPFIDLEGALALKGFFTGFGCGFFIFQYELMNLLSDFRYLFLFNQSLESIEICKIFLLINTNLRLELPLLNSRLRKNYLNNRITFKSYAIGFFNEFLGYPILSLGISNFALFQFYYGTSEFFKCVLGNNYNNNLNFLNYYQISLRKNISIFFGIITLTQLQNMTYNLFSVGFKYFKNIFFNNIFDYLGRITMFELSFGIIRKMKFSLNTFLYNCCDKKNLTKNLFSVYHGSFLFDLNLGFNLYLPASFVVERQCTFINCEGRYRFVQEVIKTPLTVYAD